MNILHNYSDGCKDPRHPPKNHTSIHLALQIPWHSCNIFLISYFTPGSPYWTLLVRFYTKNIVCISCFFPSHMTYFSLITSFLTSLTKQILDRSANYEASDCVNSVCRVSVTLIKNILFGILSSNALTSWIIVHQDVNVFSVLYFCRQLYMFRMLTPIIRGSYNCNYSFQHWSTESTTIHLCSNSTTQVDGSRPSWPVPEAVLTVVWAPDDGCQHPKHVELSTEV